MVDELGFCLFSYEIEIPASVEIMCQYAFYHCNSLSAVTFAPGSHLTHFRGFQFYVSLPRISIPASVKFLKSYSSKDAIPYLKSFWQGTLAFSKFGPATTAQTCVDWKFKAFFVASMRNLVPLFTVWFDGGRKHPNGRGSHQC
jgi:hypothetical protein